MRRLAAACLALAACATPPGHEAFQQVMDRQVGKLIDEPDAYPVFYRLRERNAKALPNGNTEHEYAAGRDGRCQLFFETDLSGRIVRWRADGSERNCVITPPSR